MSDRTQTRINKKLKNVIPKRPMAPPVLDDNGIELPALNPRQAKFVADYCIFFNASRAAREAGYDSAEYSELGRIILAKAEVQAHVRHRIKEIGELHFKLHEENTERLRSMRDADRTAILDADGNVKDPKEWPEACKQLLMGIEVEEEMRGTGDEKFLVRIKKVRLEPPRAIVDSLAKITGQWVERSQFIGKDGKPVDPAAVTPVIVVSYGDALPPKESARPIEHER